MSLRYAVLGILQHKPKHGYEIKQAIEESFGDSWNVSYGQLYPTLRNLTQKNLVIKHKEPGQKSLDKNVYKITQQGEESLLRWFSEIPKKVKITAKDEFSLLFLFLLLERSELEQKEAVEKQLLFFQKIRKQYQQQYEVTDVSQKPQKLLLKRIILRLEAEISWLNEILSNTLSNYP